MTCDDCYFRQELLCALKTRTPCPTFRATAGRSRRSGPATMATPQQAPLIPLPVRAPVGDPDPVSIPAAIADDRTTAAVPAGSQPHFGQESSEATFTLREATRVDVPEAAATICLPPPREVVFATRRAVAADRDRSSSLVVQVAAEPPGAPMPLIAAGTPRSSRIAQRIASRYPGITSA